MYVYIRIMVVTNCMYIFSIFVGDYKVIIKYSNTYVVGIDKENYGFCNNTQNSAFKQCLLLKQGIID